MVRNWPLLKTRFRIGTSCAKLLVLLLRKVRQRELGFFLCHIEVNVERDTFHILNSSIF